MSAHEPFRMIPVPCTRDEAVVAVAQSFRSLQCGNSTDHNRAAEIITALAALGIVRFREPKTPADCVTSLAVARCRWLSRDDWPFIEQSLNKNGFKIVSTTDPGSCLDGRAAHALALKVCCTPEYALDIIEKLAEAGFKVVKA